MSNIVATTELSAGVTSTLYLFDGEARVSHEINRTRAHWHKGSAESIRAWVDSVLVPLGLRRVGRVRRVEISHFRYFDADVYKVERS